MNLSEAANRVIDLSSRVSEYYDAELPKWHPNYPLVGPDDETAPPPPEEQELRDFLSTLSEDLLSQLMLLIYLGRAEIRVDELGEQYETIKGAFGISGFPISEMMASASLAAYLLDGLEELRQHKINVDKLPLKRMKTRKR